MNGEEKFSEDVIYEAYGKYLRGEYFARVRAVIPMRGDKIIFLRDRGTGRVTIPGGGIMPAETPEQAIVREVLADTGYKVKPIKLVGEDYYNTKMKIGEISFVSKRVVYIYICEILYEKENTEWEDSRWEDEPDMFLDNVSDLLDCNIKQDVVDKVKEYVKTRRKY